MSNLVLRFDPFYCQLQYWASISVSITFFQNWDWSSWQIPVHASAELIFQGWWTPKPVYEQVANMLINCHVPKGTNKALARRIKEQMRYEQCWWMRFLLIMTFKLKSKGWGGIRKDRREGVSGLGRLQKVLETCQLVGLRELKWSN